MNLEQFATQLSIIMAEHPLHSEIEVGVLYDGGDPAGIENADGTVTGVRFADGYVQIEFS